MKGRRFKVVMSPKCFRFKEDALFNHAPTHPGAYEFVTFNEQREPVVLYVGVALESMRDSLAEHLEGKAKPSADELFAVSKDVYFDFVEGSDLDGVEENKDIAAALIRKHKPRFNTGTPPSSGKYGECWVEEY